MSYAQQSDDGRRPGSAREWKGKGTVTPRSGGSVTPRSGDAFETETRKVQESVRVIQQHAGDIRKEANLLSTSPSHGMGKGKEQAQASVREARSTNDAALLALQGLLRATTGGVGGANLSAEEQNSRKFMHQKLTENLSSSIKAVDQAWIAYEAAESLALKAVRQQSTSSSMATPLVSAGVPGLDHTLDNANEADLESGRQATQAQRLQQREDVAVAAETEMHTAIVAEYARQVETVNENTQHLQRAMLDLAELTTSQGEVLDNIESSMAETAEQTTRANEELATTSTAQRSGTKKFMYILLLCGSVAALGALFT